VLVVSSASVRIAVVLADAEASVPVVDVLAEL
jgi:hypothetical protein